MQFGLLKKNFRIIMKTVYRVLPTFLSIAGSTGVIVTSILVAKETPEAVEVINERKETDITVKDKFITTKDVSKIYSKAIISGVLTIGCNLGSNFMHIQRYNSINQLYGKLASQYTNYKINSGKMLGNAAVATAAASAAKKSIEDKDYVEVIESNKYSNESPMYGEIRSFYDSYSDTWFDLDWYTVLSAHIRVQELLNMNERVSIDQYYEFLGVDTPISILNENENLVWDKKCITRETGYNNIVIQYPKVEPIDEKEAFAIDLHVFPVTERYLRIHNY